MTDTLSTEGAPTGEVVEGLDADGELPGQVFSGKPCEDCDTLLPGKGEPGFMPARKYCPVHSEEPAKAKGRNRKKDKPPAGAGPTVVINTPGGGRPSRADVNVQKVTAGATGMAQMMAGLILMGGDKVCAEAISDGAEQWGKAMGELSRYQPGLVKIFAPTGQATGQAFAWVGVFAATTGLMLPVLVHHGAIKPELAARLTGVMGAAESLAGVVDDAPDATE